MTIPLLPAHPQVRPPLFRSFGYAVAGLRVLAGERNARIHALATVVVAALAIVFRLPPLEKGALAVAVTLVWVAEALNTAIERLADAVNPQYNPMIGAAKDVAAGGVLLAAVGACVVGASVVAAHL
jgi:diacylglycerol kinase